MIISKCNSPIPEMIVCIVSWSVWTLKVGSSSVSFANETDKFSWSFLVWASTETEITGSGKSIDSNKIGLFVEDKVCPVLVYFNPTTAAISPLETSFLSSLLFECISINLPTLTFFWEVEL